MSSNLSLTLCPNCNNYPFLHFSNETPKKVFIQCDFCNYAQYNTIHDYLNYSSIIQQNYDIIELGTNNSKHCNEHLLLINSYCNTCKVHICDKCDTHEFHLKIPLIKLSISKLSKTIKEARLHINNYCKNEKEKAIQKLLEEINKIEMAYRAFANTNNEMISLYELMVKNYNVNPNNFYLRCNIVNVFGFKLTSFNGSYSIIDYFNKYSLLKESYVCLSEFTSFKTILPHNKKINELILLKDGRIASCSNDHTIKIFNIEDESILTLLGHQNDVNSICQLPNEKLVSCSLDISIKLWTITETTYNCDFTINNPHTKPIMKVIPLSNNMFVSGSQDGTIIIWNGNFYPCILINTLSTQNSIESLLYIKQEKLLVSASRTYLCIWDCNGNTHKLIAQIDDVNCLTRNSMIELKNCRILVGGITKVKIVNVITCEVEKTIGHSLLNNFSSFLILRNGNVLLGCDNGYMGMLDIQYYFITAVDKEIEKGKISCMANINEQQFICENGSTMLRVWNY